MNLEKISWPVYRIPAAKVLTHYGVTYTENLYLDPDGSERSVVKIIDDKNLPWPTLGRRRLALRLEGRPLLPINKSIILLSDLLKVVKTDTNIIDSSGALIKYKKSLMCKLTCHKILNIMRAPRLGVVLEVEGLIQRFRLFKTPPANFLYAGIISYKHTFILYGLYEESFKQTRRKI